MSALTLIDTTVRQDQHGRYCLNDLHRAAGGENRNRPSLWAANQQTKELAAEIESGAGIPALVRRARGFSQGTYACRELVYAYAAWISAAFHLKVIRAFDALAAGRFTEALDIAKGKDPHKRSTTAERQPVLSGSGSVVSRCGVLFSTAYRAMSDRVGVKHCRQMTRAQVAEAAAFAQRLCNRTATREDFALMETNGRTLHGEPVQRSLFDGDSDLALGGAQ